MPLGKAKERSLLRCRRCLSYVAARVANMYALIRGGLGSNSVAFFENVPLLIDPLYDNVIQLAWRGLKSGNSISQTHLKIDALKQHTAEG